MEKIPSFTVNHLNLEPGIYISRQDHVGDQVLTSYDLRVTRPNREPVMNTGEIHTIEHLAATYMRNDDTFKDDVIYFGPMGCRTGFYFILKPGHTNKAIKAFITETFEFISTFNDTVPGVAARDCGNWLDHNLEMARYYAKRYVSDLNQTTDTSFAYID